MFSFVVNLSHGNRHSINRANANGMTIFGISKLVIAGYSLPSSRLKNSPARVRDC